MGETLTYLGRVTPQGLVPPRPKLPLRYGGALDAGNILFLDRFLEPRQAALVEPLPQDWQSLLSAATLKLCYLDPFSLLQLRY